MRDVPSVRIEWQRIDATKTLRFVRDVGPSLRRPANAGPVGVARVARPRLSIVAPLAPTAKPVMHDGVQVRAAAAAQAIAPGTTVRRSTQRRQLVWQTPSRSRDPANVAEAPAATTAQPADRSASHASPAPAEIANAVAAHMRTTTATWTEPDRAAFDRLANEVMRRVEKDLRIERERRGR